MTVRNRYISVCRVTERRVGLTELERNFLQNVLLCVTTTPGAIIGFYRNNKFSAQSYIYNKKEVLCAQ